MDMKRLFLFSWKKLGLVVLAFLVAVILHNLVSAWLNTEEALFFILAVFIIPLYALMVLAYSIYYFFRSRR